MVYKSPWAPLFTATVALGKPPLPSNRTGDKTKTEVYVRVRVSGNSWKISKHYSSSQNLCKFIQYNKGSPSNRTKPWWRALEEEADGRAQWAPFIQPLLTLKADQLNPPLWGSRGNRGHGHCTQMYWAPTMCQHCAGPWNTSMNWIGNNLCSPEAHNLLGGERPEQ